MRLALPILIFLAIALGLSVVIVFLPIGVSYLTGAHNPDAEKLSEAAGWLEKQLPYFEQLLGQAEFLCGDELSIADSFAWSYLTISDNTSVSLDAYPRLQAWYKKMGQRPAVQRAMAKVFGQKS